MNTYSLNLKDEEIEKLKTIFIENISYEDSNPYLNFKIRVENCTINIYKSKKVVFQGKDAHIYASSFLNTDFKEEAGSDEVGTGDFFGPVVVCASYISLEVYNKIKNLKIADSKTITDEKIREIGPRLIDLVPHSLLILNNQKYNQVHKTNNMNQIKAKLHNKALLSLNEKIQLPQRVIIDQFTPSNTYFKYLENEKEVYKNIHFETKAESKYLSVATSSVIARYAFLSYLDKMNEKYNFNFIKGASDKVDMALANFVKEFGEEELKNVAKLHFKNMTKYKDYL